MFMKMICQIFIIQEHFVYMKMLKNLRIMGLAKGGSLDNAIVVKEIKY